MLNINSEQTKRTLPNEWIVRESIDQIPAQLLCQEVFDPTQIRNLRQERRVTESIRQPKDITVAAELLFEVHLAEEELLAERETARDISVHFHPTTSDWNEVA